MTDKHIRPGADDPWIAHLGDGLARLFTAPFPFRAADDLAVWIDGEPASGKADYTISGAGAPGGGGVRFAGAPAPGARIVIARRQAFSRISDFLAGSALRASALNAEFDHLTMMAQELRSAQGRSLRAAPQEQGAIAELPPIAARAGRLLSFDESGDPTVIATAAADIDAALSSAADAAQSAERAARSAAVIDIAELTANQQAGLRAAPDMPPAPRRGIPALAHQRRSLIFAPEAATALHVYRPTDSGAWHILGADAGEQWFDLAHLGIGQSFCAAVAHDAASGVVIDPGVDNAGAANRIAPFAAGEKIRLLPGEGIVIAARSINADGGHVSEVMLYSASPGIDTDGQTYRLGENQFGLFDGDSMHELTLGANGIRLPPGYRIDRDHPQLSYPILSSFGAKDQAVPPPVIQLATMVVALSFGGSDTAFAINDVLAVRSHGGTLRVQHVTDDGELGLTLLGGEPLAVGDVLVNGDIAAEVRSVTPVEQKLMPAGLIAFIVDNPNRGSVKLHIHWRNLEKYR